MHEHPLGASSWRTPELLGAMHKSILERNEFDICRCGMTALDDRGVELPDEVDLDEAMLVIRDRDGNEIGSWRIEEIEELKRSLKSVRLSPNARH